MQIKKEIETVPVATRITRPMLKRIQSVLEKDAHINTAEYIRDLIRRDLETRGIEIEKS